MEKEYSKYVFLVTALVVVAMLCISFIPPFTIGGVKLRRANIFSDIYKFSGDTLSSDEVKITDVDRAFLKEMESLGFLDGGEMAADNSDSDDVLLEGNSWNLSAGEDISKVDPPSGQKNSVATATVDPKDAYVIKIEDYTPEEGVSVSDFCTLLGTATEKRIVRLGFLGDSYIEGDIITADIRDQLQSLYGGGGVGFVPFETPLAANRPTVKHTYGEWKNYNIIYKKSASAQIKDRFFVSGIVSKPLDGAWSKYRSVSFRKNLPKVTTARIIFTNTVGSTINMTVNDTIERKFTPEVSDQVQQINVSGGRIESLKIEIGDPEGFYGYGVVMEAGRGVSVDNYSVRGNSGLALFGSNGAVNSRIDRTLGYDLIVLQYGLNIMQAETTGYGWYGQHLRKIINFVKSCFPRAAIIVMGVGDRSMQQDGEFVTMPAVKSLVATQRAAAKDCGVAFWNTFAAMGGENGMNNFVEKGWAARDYTHLSYSGGRKIATEFVKALDYAKRHSDESVDVMSDESSQAVNAVEQRVESLSSFGAVGEAAEHVDSSVSVVVEPLPEEIDADSSVRVTVPD